MKPLATDQTLRAFKWIAIAEGISFLLILFVTMPLKYFWALPEPNKMVGTVHGILFILYVMGTVVVKPRLKWSLTEFGLAGFASIVPFATFWVERKLVNEKI